MQTRERSPFAPSRRRLAGMLAAGAVLATSTVHAAGADAELLALGRELEAAWTVEREACARLSSVDSAEADAEFSAVCDRAGDVVSRIEGLTATTLAGLRVKLRALEWTLTGDPLSVATLFDRDAGTADHRLIVAILNDLRTVG